MISEYVNRYVVVHATSSTTLVNSSIIDPKHIANAQPDSQAFANAYVAG
jgi:hypothetical protein